MGGYNPFKGGGGGVTRVVPLSSNPLDPTKYGGDIGGKIGSAWDDNIVGLGSRRRAKEAEERSGRLADELYGKTGDINKSLSKVDADYYSNFDKAAQSYLGSATKNTNSYLGDISKLKKQSEDQAKDARFTYSNSILPNAKDAMELSKANAHSAMTLEEAMDPNNKVMTSIRGLYDKLGQQERSRGQADYGVLSALGAQSAQNTFGASGNPMTAGMMGQIYGANQQQAGDAYAKALQRVQDLQQQGIDRGFDQSNLMYEYGQNAQDRYSQRIKDISDLQGANINQLGALRGEQGGYAGNLLDARQGLNTDKFNIGNMGAGIMRDIGYAGGAREQDALNQLYGVKGQGVSNTLAASLAGQQGGLTFLSSLIGAGAKAAGGA